MSIALEDLEILDLVAVGGMAEVYRAHLTAPDGSVRPVAVKKILPQFTADEELVRMFQDESRLGEQLHHPNIVQVMGLVGDDSGDLYMVMEFADGKDLADLIHASATRKQALSPALVVHIARETLKALGYAHHARGADGRPLGLIHRDVSPHNVMVGFDGWVKLTDFGVAKAARRAHATQAGMVKGKFGYMSPEQARGRPLDARSDLFNVGILLYEMLTGQRLFDGASDIETLERMRSPKVPALPPRRCPEDLDALMRRVLAANPDDRPADARTLDQELAQVASRNRLLAGPDQVAELMGGLFGESKWAHEPAVRRPPRLAPSGKELPDPDANESTRMESEADFLGKSGGTLPPGLDPDGPDPTRMEPGLPAALVRRPVLDAEAADPTRNVSEEEEEQDSTRMEPPPPPPPPPPKAAVRLPDEPAAVALPGKKDPPPRPPTSAAVALPAKRPPPAPEAAVALPGKPEKPAPRKETRPATSAAVALPGKRPPAPPPPVDDAPRPPPGRHSGLTGLLEDEPLDDEPPAAMAADSGVFSAADSGVFGASPEEAPRRPPTYGPQDLGDPEDFNPAATAMIASPLEEVNLRVQQKPRAPARKEVEWHEPSLAEESGAKMRQPPPPKPRPAPPPEEFGNTGDGRPLPRRPMESQIPTLLEAGDPALPPLPPLPRASWLPGWPVWAAALVLLLASAAGSFWWAPRFLPGRRQVSQGSVGGTVLVVRSSPPGAKVTVDGILMKGVTPLTVPEPLPAGAHKIAANLAGTVREATVNLTDRQKAANVVVQFEGDGTVEVKSRLAGALVYVDAQRVGLAPQRLTWLGRERPHIVRVVVGNSTILDELVKPDRPAQVTLEAGSDGPGGYPVTVLSTPPAWVSLGGKDLGRTTGGVPFKLPAGRHGLTLRVPSLGMEREVFVESTGRSKKYFFDLYR